MLISYQASEHASLYKENLSNTKNQNFKESSIVKSSIVKSSIVKNHETSSLPIRDNFNNNLDEIQENTGEGLINETYLSSIYSYLKAFFFSVKESPDEVIYSINNSINEVISNVENNSNNQNRKSKKNVISDKRKDSLSAF
jgi:hypothetical protein